MSHDPTPQTPVPDLTDAEIEALEAEIPLLAGIRAFAGEAARLPWFSRIGRPLDLEERALARAYLDALGFPDVEVARVGSWAEAADAAESLDWDTAPWEAEEGLRAALASEALTQLSGEALHVALAHATALLGPALRRAAAEVAALWDEGDEALLNAAVGAALQTAHGVVLALAAEAGNDHAFRRKFALFARGRWPIGIAGRTFNLF